MTPVFQHWYHRHNVHCCKNCWPCIALKYISIVTFPKEGARPTVCRAVRFASLEFLRAHICILQVCDYPSITSAERTPRTTVVVLGKHKETVEIDHRTLQRAVHVAVPLAVRCVMDAMPGR